MKPQTKLIKEVQTLLDDWVRTDGEDVPEGDLRTLEKVIDALQEAGSNKAIQNLRGELEKREKYWRDWNGRAANRNAKLEARINELEN